MDKLSVSSAFEDIHQCMNGPEKSHEAVISKYLRSHFPQYHVTCTEKSQILEFAAAGHAVTSPNLSFEIDDITRRYKQPIPRSDPGALIDDVRLGQHDYSWKGVDLLMFELSYSRPFEGTTHVLFILAPRDSGTITNGRHSVTENLIYEAGQWGRIPHEEVYVFKDARWQKDKELWKSVQNSSWEDVVMDPQLKENLIHDVQGFFDSKNLYREFAVPWKRGIILHGLPGNGKTMSIKAMMQALSQRDEEIPSLYVKSLKSCHGPYFSLNQIFTQARALAPCLLILEDLDSLISSKVRSFFLNEVDGIVSGDLGILIIGTTNHLSKLDPAVAQRPSRFDRKYHFDAPAYAQRLDYCRLWKSKVAKNNLVAFPEELCEIIAKLTETFTFAYLKELFVSTLLRIARESTTVNGELKAVSSRVSLGRAPENLEDAANGLKTNMNGGCERKKKDEKKENTTQPAQESRQKLPEVEIPVSLQENLLLKTFIDQAGILLREMEVTSAQTSKDSASRKSNKTAEEGVSDKDEDDDDCCGPMYYR